MELQILIWTAISIGFIHTIIGPDHYLPFIMISRARQWTIIKTMWVTFFCGIGHVLGSVLLGIVGVMLGLSIGLLENVETVRGDIASWLLVGFGIAYAAWGLRIGLRAAKHTHEHDHDGHDHQHTHHHLGSHAHLHGNPKSITLWALFIIFVLGPCEPLIPILMYPAAQGSWLDLAWVTLAFGITTVGTMTLVVFVISKGLININLGFLEKYAHAIAGLIIAIAGLSIKLFGL
ncbi:sulfite exporter TauE/SafE family protein [Candidatus Neomarinimicrobiota bacterium]